MQAISTLSNKNVANLANPKDGIINKSLTNIINIIVNLKLIDCKSVSIFMFLYSLNISLFNINLLKTNNKIGKDNNIINIKIDALALLKRIAIANKRYKIVEQGK